MSETKEERQARFREKIFGPARESTAGLDVETVIERMGVFAEEIVQPNGLLNAGTPDGVFFNLKYSRRPTPMKKWEATITMIDGKGWVKRKKACADDPQRAVRDCASSFVAEYGANGREGGYRPSKEFD